MATQNRLTAAEWRQHIEAQLASGQTQLDYCRGHGLSVHAFRDRKYRGARHASTATGEGGPSVPAQPWIELPSGLAASTPGWQIELDLGNGVCLRLRQG